MIIDTRIRLLFWCFLVLAFETSDAASKATKVWVMTKLVLGLLSIDWNRFGGFYEKKIRFRTIGTQTQRRR